MRDANVSPARETRDPRTVQGDGYSTGGSPEARRFAQAAPQGLQEPGLHVPAPLSNKATPRQQRAYGLEAALMGHQEGHVEGRPMRDSAIAGLNGLSAADPAVRFDRRDDRVVMSRNGKEQESFKAPADNDHVGWGRLMTNASEAAGDHNPRIKRLGDQGAYEAMQHGMTDGMDPHTRFVPQRELDQQRTVI